LFFTGISKGCFHRAPPSGRPDPSNSRKSRSGQPGTPDGALGQLTFHLAMRKTYLQSLAPAEPPPGRFTKAGRAPMPDKVESKQSFSSLALHPAVPVDPVCSAACGFNHSNKRVAARASCAIKSPPAKLGGPCSSQVGDWRPGRT
jgi:hypothetical protein